MYESSLLTGSHHLTQFDCGNTQLNGWLKSQALHDQQAGQNRTTVWTESGDSAVVAFYSLGPHLDLRQNLGTTRSMHQGYNLIPGYLLARLALDRSLQGAGNGKQLLLDALGNALDAGRKAGGRLVYVDAVDDEALRFYEHHGFTETGVPNRLIMRLRDIAESLGEPPL